MSGRTVVLTGGTAGIGAALTAQLRNRGDRVVVVGRRAAREDAIAVDLQDADAAAFVERELRRIGVSSWDLLIHNAGVGWVGAFTTQSSDSIRMILEVNAWAPIALAHRLSSMASPKARVLFVSSPTAHLPSPDYAVYAASKAAIEAFARSLRAERVGLEIQVVRPGATVTELLTDTDAASLAVSKSRFATAETTASRMMRRINGRPKWSSTDPASKFVVGLHRWGDSHWLRRAPRIPWPSDLLATPNDKGPMRALITGAGGGIGRALALRFSQAGFAVVGIDCDEERLQETVRLLEQTGGRASPIVHDLSDTYTTPRLVELLSRYAPFDVVIHNAGINRFGRFPHTNLDEQRRVFDVNLLTPVLLTRELLANGLLAKGCRLGFVSSLSHFVGYPGSAVYAATKSGLASFAASLAAVGPSIGFSATTIFPGPTNTRQARENSPDNAREDRRMEPRALAQKIVRAMMRRQSILVPGLANWIAASLGKRFPGLSDAVMRKALLPSNQRGRAVE